jgi:hypothetical protein
MKTTLAALAFACLFAGTARAGLVDWTCTPNSDSSKGSDVWVDVMQEAFGNPSVKVMRRIPNDAPMTLIDIEKPDIQEMTINATQLRVKAAHHNTFIDIDAALSGTEEGSPLLKGKMKISPNLTSDFGVTGSADGATLDVTCFPELH